MSEKSPPRIYITLAEHSADVLAGHLVTALRERLPAASVRGIGGPLLAGAGAEIDQNSVRGAAMGLAAAGRVFEVGRYLKLVEAIYSDTSTRPDLHICIDSWSMNKHFAALAKRHGVPVLYYVAPQAWASRAGRAKKLGALADKVACILPFEPAWFASHGCGQAVFVGHPLFDELPAEQQRSPAVLREGRPPTIAVLPGSRVGVIRANWVPLMAVARELSAKFPGARFVVPLATTALPDDALLPADIQNLTFLAPPHGVHEALRQADVVVCVSGTAALHVAAYRVPLVVVYRGSALLWNLVGRWIVKSRTYSLVNLLAGAKLPPAGVKSTPVAKEFIPWNGHTGGVVAEVTRLLTEPAAHATALAALDRMISPLDRPGASAAAADLAVALLAGRNV